MRADLMGTSYSPMALSGFNARAAGNPPTALVEIVRGHH